MASQIRFPSVMHPETTGYILLGSYFDRPDRLRGNRIYEVADWVLRFDTLGDGMTQHAPEMSVPTTCDNMTDVLGSLAILCQENPAALEMTAHNWPMFDEVSRPRVITASKIKYREDKRQYVNVNDLSVSSADSKRHDKRWIEMYSPLDDNRLQTIFQLLNLEHRDLSGIAVYGRYMAIIDTLHDEGAIGCVSIGSIRSEFNDDHAGLLANSWSALASLVQSHQSRGHADRSLECFRSNLANRARIELAHSA